MNLRNRHSIRLEGYDYSKAGIYFITICVKDREPLLGRVEEGILLSSVGSIIEEQWYILAERFCNIKLHDFVVMPNHIHGIIEIMWYERAEQSPAPTVGDIICVYKSLTTKICNKKENLKGRVLWQRNYWEHIIRNENEYYKISEYIISNPLKWQEDKFYC